MNIIRIYDSGFTADLRQYAAYVLSSTSSRDYVIVHGGYSEGDPPLPFPNREVKPVSADGTAEMWESRSTPTFKESYSNTE